jgi:phage-related protein
VTWRVVYGIDPDAVVILDVFVKKTPKPPASVMRACRRRLRAYDSAVRGQGEAP